MDIFVVLVSEDELSESVLRRLLAHSGRPFNVTGCISARGFGNIKRGVPTYKSACKAVPHIVLTDLDNAPCPPALISSWGLANCPSELMFRVAVREIEAWLLADVDGMSAFLSVPATRFPTHPEAEPDPKQTLLNIARRSRQRRMRDEIVPPPGSSASQGPFYNQHFCRFVRDNWDVQRATLKAPSLARMIQRLNKFMA